MSEEPTELETEELKKRDKRVTFLLTHGEYEELRLYSHTSREKMSSIVLDALLKTDVLHTEGFPPVSYAQLQESHNYLENRISRLGGFDVLTKILDDAQEKIDLGDQELLDREDFTEEEHF